MSLNKPEPPFSELQQVRLIVQMRQWAYEMAYGRGSDGLRYAGWENLGMVERFLECTIQDLARLRCTDGEGVVTHEVLGDHCTRCGCYR